MDCAQKAADAFEVLFETSRDFIGLLTADGRLSRINQNGLRELEIEDPARILGAEWASLWPPAHQKEVREAVHAALAGVSATFQGYCPTARGAPKWWDVAVSPVHGADGVIVALLAIGRDMTDVATGRPALITLVEGGAIVGWSAEAQAMFGFSAQEAIGQSIDLVLPQRLREASRAWSEQIVATGEGEQLGRPIRSIAIRRTGDEFPIECVISALPSKGGWMLLASVHDLSSSKAHTDLFENAFQNAPIGQALVSLEGRFLKLNPAFCSLVEYDEATLLASDFQSITHPDDLEADLVLLERLLAGEVPDYQMDKRYIRADGLQIWVNLSVSLVRFADGRPKFFVAQVQDLTARRKAEGNYRLLAESVGDVVSLMDGHGRCLYASPSALRVFGYAPEEMIGMAPYSLLPEHAHGSFRILTERLAAQPRGETVTQQLPLLHKDGHTVWIEVACRNIDDDEGRPVTMVVARDVTARLKTERRYRLLADNMADILVLADLDGHATFVAGACERILGWTPDEVLAQRDALLVHPEDFNRVNQAFRRAGQGERDLRVRFRSRCKDDAWRWLESQPSRCIAEDGALGVVDAIRDVTAQVAQEEALAQAREEAEAAALAKSRFLANMSHEIRTPLTSVIGFSDLLLGRKRLQPDVRRYAERISSASRALLTLVNDVLDFSKIEAGQFEIRPAPARPLEVVEESMAIFTAAAEAKGVQLRLETAVAGNLAAEIDAVRVRQILLNLIGNALKFTDKGEVVVRLDCAGGRMAVAVQDTGPGIAPEDQAKLFQRFSQVDASSTRRHGGTGLGLAICKGLVEAMGGAIEVRSRLGKGSTFRFDITAAETVDQARPLPQTETAAHVERVRILVADDNPVNRELVRAILEGFGAEVSEAADGQDAVEVARSAPYDVILMDLRMPRLDGRGALMALRASAGPNQDTPVLAFTADVLEAELDGFAGYIGKPIEPARLAEAIERCVAAPPAQSPSASLVC